LSSDVTAASCSENCKYCIEWPLTEWLWLPLLSWHASTSSS
jgi:hypothetical protein